MAIWHHCEVAADRRPEPPHVLLGAHNGWLLAVSTQDSAGLDPRLQLLVPGVGSDEVDDGYHQLVVLLVNTCRASRTSQDESDQAR